nr:MAG TPA: hypothetical protein [Caudoviricetes sp.]
MTYSFTAESEVHCISVFRPKMNLVDGNLATGLLRQNTRMTQLQTQRLNVLTHLRQRKPTMLQTCGAQ